MTDPNEFVEALIGKPVSHVWRGYGSAILLEFGELVPVRNGRGGERNPFGELCLMIEWSWRIENPRSILGGSSSSEGKWQGMFKKILGATATNVEFFGAVPEICVSFDNGRRVLSFSTVEGQPEWAIIARKPALGNLCVRGGRCYVESAPNNGFNSDACKARAG